MTLRPHVDASLRLLATVAASALIAALVASADAQQPAPHPQPSRASPSKGPAPAATGSPPATSEVSRRPPLGGYLGEQRLPDYRLFLPPPPAAGSPLAVADAAIFEETRKLENGSRWQLAANDDRINLKAVLEDFGCSAGPISRRSTRPPSRACSCARRRICFR